MNRRIASRMLERLGCTCDAIEDGDTILQALIQSRKPYDVILLDIIMVKSNGLDICKSLRDQEVEIPIIAATANYSAKEASLYKSAGFSRVLQVCLRSMH